MSSMSMAARPTDPAWARSFAPGPVEGRSARGALLAAFAASGRRLLSPGGISMTGANPQPAPPRFSEANGIRFAYRRFGKAGGVPIVFNQHYLGTMDYW